MSVATPRADVLEALDVHGDFAHEFSFRQFFFHAGAKSCLFRFRECIGLRIQIQAEFCEDSFGERPPDAFDGCEGDLDALITR